MTARLSAGLVLAASIVLLLLAAARGEEARMRSARAAAEGRSIERGAGVFRDQCAGCHGIAGGGIEGVAPALASQGWQSRRLIDLGYAATLEMFVEGTVAGGRTIGSGDYRSAMPAFAQGLGGPLRSDQVGDVVRFVVDCAAGADAGASGPTPPPSALGTVTEGDPVVARGKVAYQANACLGCHDWPGRGGVTGPDLAGLPTRRAEVAPDLTGEQFIRLSILAPSAHVAPDCPTGPCPDMMPRTYGDDLPQEDLDAIVAYLLTLE